MLAKLVCDTDNSSIQQTELNLVHRCHKLLLDSSSTAQLVIIVTSLRVGFRSRFGYRLDFGCCSDRHPVIIMGSSVEVEVSISLQLVPNSMTGGGLPPSPRTSPSRGIKLKQGEIFPFLLVYIKGNIHSKFSDSAMSKSDCMLLT